MNEQTYLEQQNESMGENSFMKKLLKKRLNQKGLTLIELLAVIVILAIVAAIAIPAIGNIINNSNDKGVLSSAQSVIAGAKLANAAGECDTGTCANDVLLKYVDNGEITAGGSTTVTVDGWVLNGWSGWTDLSAADSDFAPADTDTVAESEIITLLGD